MKAIRSNKTYTLFFSVIFLMLLFYSLVFTIQSYNSEHQIVQRFQSRFLEQQSLLNEHIPEVVKILSGPKENYWPRLERLLNDNLIYTQIYYKDSLIFWNNSHIPLVNHSSANDIYNPVVNTPTGWYLSDIQTFQQFDIHLFREIKTEYSVSNSYLPVRVNPAFSNYKNIAFTQDTLQTNNIIRDNKGKAVLAISIPKPILIDQSFTILLFLLFVLTYIFLLSWIKTLYLTLGGAFSNKTLLFSLFILDVFILRILDYFLRFPAVLKESFLFETTDSGLSGFNSTGDLFLNAVLLLFLAVTLFRFVRQNEKPSFKNSNNRQSIIILMVFWLLSFALFFLVFTTVEHSPYTSYFGVLFKSFDGIANLISVVFLIVALFVFLLTVLRYLKIPKSFLLVFLSFAALLLLVNYFDFFGTGKSNLFFIFTVCTLFIGLIFLVLFLSKQKTNISTETYLLMLVIFAGTTAIIINRAEKEVRDKHQLKATNYLSQTHQADLESAYSTIYHQIQNDTIVQKIISQQHNQQDEELTTYLQATYFKGFWEKYTLQLTLCSKGEQLEIQPENILVNCSEYFSNLVNDFGEQTVEPNLKLLHADPESIYYLGLIEFNQGADSASLQQLYLEFFYTIVPKGLGYPELLVDQNLSDVDLTAYSFARYENDILVYKFGNFSYHTDFRYLEEYPEECFFYFMNYRHYKVKVAPDNYLIVSRPKVLLTERLSTFSILFLVFSLILFFRMLILFGKPSKATFNFNFQTRLQSVFTGSIAVIILLLAIVTMYYVRNSRETNLTDQLNEKTYSVLIELQHKLSGGTQLTDADSESLSGLLRKFSMVFFSDINLYNTSGQLIATSRPEIFEKGLLSKNINPQAFEELFVDDKLFYFTDEKIGSLTYYSSYVPLFLNENKPSGIINLPYFARQNEVRQSYYQMLFTFINLFVILGIIGIFIALILSKILTKPLQVLQRNLANIRIDKQNEKIKWNKSDEIGKLIEEYNRMVDKLEQSAELLKHSERESAWRDVARQIAHEIKNPLTPMKLNVQFLEKAYSEKDPDFKEKIKTITASLIEQIESLNNVAEMFADFSKSTTQHLSEIDLIPIIQSSVALFKNNRAVEINFAHQHEAAKTLAPADGKDILRIFNNLLKNSIQSISDASRGEIKISIVTQQQWHIVRISDNGKGIDDETKQMIFQPYFTTKSTGTGLGLAIVKSIMNGIGGEIEFESEAGKGSVFTLRFKVVSP